MSSQFKTVRSKTGKVYTYAKGKSATIVDSLGRVRTKARNAIIAELKAKGADPDLISEAEAYIDSRSSTADTLTISGLQGHLTHYAFNRAGGLMYSDKRTRIATMLANAGVSEDEAAQQLGVNVNDVLDEANWQGDIFTNPYTGQQFKFNFTYQGAKRAFIPL